MPDLKPDQVRAVLLSQVDRERESALAALGRLTAEQRVQILKNITRPSSDPHMELLFRLAVLAWTGLMLEEHDRKQEADRA